jgi:hypothetical protein
MSAPDWQTLSKRYPRAWVDHLERLDAERSSINVTPESLGELAVESDERRLFTDLRGAAAELLDELSRSEWLLRTLQRTCPVCGFEVPADHVGDVCPNPEPPSHAFTDGGDPGVRETHLYQRQGVASRAVGWLLALHGMNTRGSWQESFNWLVSTSYGRMVPVAIYKYGVVRPGVLFRRRHDTFVDRLAERISFAGRQAAYVVKDPRPDVIAHSFGTLLLGKALHKHRTLRVRRVVTLGCILRPDFDWATLVERGQVEAILNHFGTRDAWVKRAHASIPDAGPAGRRGFDFYEERWPPDRRAEGDRVLFNVPAEGFDHSDFFEDEGAEPTRLSRQFREVWKPFLTTLEIGEVGGALTRSGHRPIWPEARWTPRRWPRRAMTGGWKSPPHTYSAQPSDQ